MRGLRITTPDDEHAGEGTSDFERLFGFPIPSLHDHRWLIDGGLHDPFDWPPSWYGDEARMEWLDSRIEKTPRGILIDIAFLLTYMGRLTDFDISLFDFPEREVDLSRWELHRMVVASRECVFESPASAELVFLNKVAAQ